MARIKSRLQAVYGDRLRGIVLYGSEARGEATPDSDVDILVLLAGSVALGQELHTIIEMLYPLQLEMERVLEAFPVDEADTNRWREPTDEERERMNDDRSLRVLHDAERFAAETLRRATTDAERCEWIEVLFKTCEAVEDSEETVLPTLRGFEPAEGYRLIGRLFQSVLREKVATMAYSRAEKQARVASQWLSRVLNIKAQKARRSAAKIHNRHSSICWAIHESDRAYRLS